MHFDLNVPEVISEHRRRDLLRRWCASTSVRSVALDEVLLTLQRRCCCLRHRLSFRIHRAGDHIDVHGFVRHLCHTGRGSLASAPWPACRQKHECRNLEKTYHLIQGRTRRRVSIGCTLEMVVEKDEVGFKPAVHIARAQLGITCVMAPKRSVNVSRPLCQQVPVLYVKFRRFHEFWANSGPKLR